MPTPTSNLPIQDTRPGMGGYSTPWNPNLSTEPAVVSTSQGQKVLDQHVADHQNDMNKLVVNNTPATEPVKPDNPYKMYGGVSAEEAKAAGIDLADYNFDQQSGVFLPKSMYSGDQALTEDEKKVNKTFEPYLADLNTAVANQAANIKSLYSERIAAANQLNFQDTKLARTYAIRYGRYAPNAGRGILTTAESVGFDRLSKINQDESTALAQADQALQDKKFQVFVEKRNEVKALRSERQSELSKVQTIAQDEAKKQKDRVAQATRDQAIIDELNKGTTDPKLILSNLNKNGGQFTAKDVEDTMKMLNPNGDVSKLSSDARDFFILKNAGGKALPASITSLPEDQQLMAYIKMKSEMTKKATTPKSPAANKLTPQEANKYGMPPEMIGMDEKEVLLSLQNEEPPQWFLDLLVGRAGGNKTVVASTGMTSSLWDQFRNETLSQVNPGPKADTRSKAVDYFKGTYGSQISEEQLNALAERVELYVNGGMSYKDAVAKTVSEASQ